MSFVDGQSGGFADDLQASIERARSSTDALGVSAAAFARAMTGAFAEAASGGKKFDDVLKSLALRLSSLAVRNALGALTRELAGGLSNIVNGVFGGPKAGGIVPFASGGVIGAPSYFPLANGALGLAGEAGPEAIVPLARGTDGRLGVAMSGAAPVNVTVQIATPDAQSFRRSEAYVTGQIARAVARGQRSL